MSSKTIPGQIDQAGRDYYSLHLISDFDRKRLFDMTYMTYLTIMTLIPAFL